LQVFTRRVGFIRKNGVGCTSISDVWKNVSTIGMNVSGIIHVKESKYLYIGIVLDVGNPTYYGIVEVSAELPEPKPLRGPSYLSAIGAEAAQILVDTYKKLQIKSDEMNPSLTLDGTEITPKEMCKVEDITKEPGPIELKTIRRGIEMVCSSPIYVDLEDIMEDLKVMASAAVRGISKVLRPICYSDPFTLVIAESSIGLTVIALGSEEGALTSGFGF